MNDEAWAELIKWSRLILRERSGGELQIIVRCALHREHQLVSATLAGTSHGGHGMTPQLALEALHAKLREHLELNAQRIRAALDEP